MTLARSLLVTILFALAACERASTSAPTAASWTPPQWTAGGPIRVAPGADENVSASLIDFVESYAAGRADPKTYLDKTVDGGPAHPRITLIFMTDPGWCGSGGCTIIVLEPLSDGYAFLGHMTVSYAPVRILSSRSHGMPDIGVRVRGDDVDDPAREVAVPFNGVRYAPDPTMPPSRPVDSAAHGELVFSDAEVWNAFRE